jgi:FtsP/CotA-like multicopper oxidase with cupredoxin domain
MAHVFHFNTTHFDAMLLTRRQWIAGAAAYGASLTAARGADDGFRMLEAREGALRLAGDAETKIWGFNGAAPGPALRYRKGDEVKIRFVNKLAQPAAIHWGGMRIVNAMDGVPDLTQSEVAPGAAFDYRFIVPDPGTYWYRASSGRDVAEQVARGLAGVLIVDEPERVFAHREILAAIQDWSLDPQGAITSCGTSFNSEAEFRGAGRIGALLSVNGVISPQTHAIEPGSRVRLRLANLCTARIMAVTFEGFQPFVIGVDGQPCGAFEPLRRTLPVGPGARFDLLFDLPEQEGARAAVRLTGTDITGGGPDRDLIIFDLKGPAVAPASSPIIAPPLNDSLPPIIRLERATRLDLMIEGGFASEARSAPRACMAPGAPVWKINGKSGAALMEKPLFTVTRGTPVSLGFINRSRTVEVVSVHGHALRQLHLLDDGWEPYWRDSIIVPAGKTARVAFVADNPGKWRIGSAILEHAVSGFSAWFEVT